MVCVLCVGDIEEGFEEECLDLFSFHCGLGINDWGLDGKQEEDGKGFFEKNVDGRG